MVLAIAQNATLGCWDITSLIRTALSWWKLFLAPAFLVYLFLVSWLRFRRAYGLRRQYSHLSKDAFSRMTVDEAFAIHNDLVQLEFPTVVSMATFFALFKVSSLFTIALPRPHRLLVTRNKLFGNQT